MVASQSVANFLVVDVHLITANFDPKQPRFRPFDDKLGVTNRPCPNLGRVRLARNQTLDVLGLALERSTGELGRDGNVVETPARYTENVRTFWIVKFDVGFFPRTCRAAE